MCTRTLRAYVPFNKMMNLCIPAGSDHLGNCPAGASSPGRSFYTDLAICYHLKSLKGVFHRPEFTLLNRVSETCSYKIRLFFANYDILVSRSCSLVVSERGELSF
jgi:hypothetical protein